MLFTLSNWYDKERQNWKNDVGERGCRNEDEYVKIRRLRKKLISVYLYIYN